MNRIYRCLNMLLIDYNLLSNMFVYNVTILYVIILIPMYNVPNYYIYIRYSLSY